jgi:hypothetical protein
LQRVKILKDKKLTMHNKKKRITARIVMTALVLLATISAMQMVYASKPLLFAKTITDRATKIESSTSVFSYAPLTDPIEINSQSQTSNSKSSWNEETTHV